MFHHHYEGHFDPRDPVDTTLRPCQPKVQRPILRGGFERFLASFADDIGEFVCWCMEGYVICDWSYAPHKLWEAVHRFAYALADSEGAVVMSEMFFVEYPQSALKAFQEEWAEKEASRAM